MMTWDIKSGWWNDGCYTDDSAVAAESPYKTNRALTHRVPYGPRMSNGRCIAECEKGGYSIAGTEFGSECYCGNKIGNGHVKAEKGGCDSECTAASGFGLNCGGKNKLTVWRKVI